MVDNKSELEIFPSEIWLKIFKFLDLKTQKIVSTVNKNFLSLVLSIWRTKLIKLTPLFRQITGDYKSVKLKLVMNAHLDDKAVPVDQILPTDLYDILTKYNGLTDSVNLAQAEHAYAFYHDYGSVCCKYLDLTQKWPRPGAKSLERFISGNKA